MKDDKGAHRIVVTGTPADETLTGTNDADTLDGLGGNDILFGLLGIDTMIGGTGDDVFHVEDTGDIVTEAVGEGNDRIVAYLTYVLANGVEVETIEAVTPTATDAMDLQGNDFAQTITGNDGVNILRGQGGADILIGLGGNDFLVGGTGIDDMTGGDGNDTYYVEDTGDVLHESVGGGTDRVAASASYTLAAGVEVEQLEAVNLAATNAMSLTGNEFVNLITGNAGANVIDGGGGADVMTGGAGDDIYYVDDSGDVVNEAAGGGIDRVGALVSYALTPGASIETLEVVNQTSSYAIDLTGSDIGNVIRGNQGDNVLSGAGGDDVIDAFLGNDVLIGGTGNDRMYGGAGDDTYYVDSAGDLVNENAGEGYDRVAASASIKLPDQSYVERLEAINLTDTTPMDLGGGVGDQLIIGNNGPNSFYGGPGIDTFIGLGGDDSILGGFEDDVMYGGTGNDTYTVWDQGTKIIELPGEGSDTVLARFNYALPAGADIEFLGIWSGQSAGISLTGNELSQTITGNGAANTISGGGGEDIMIGLGGSDRYIVDSAGDVVQEAISGAPEDRISTSISYTLAADVGVEILEPLTISGTDAIDLTGNQIRNVINGNNGINTLDGGGSNDIMAGNGGADTFQFTTALAATNVDTLADFASGTDRIALDDAIFTGLALGALPASAFVLGTTAGDPDDRIIYDASGRLFFDADGNGPGAAVQFATLTGHPALVATDFIVI